MNASSRSGIGLLAALGVVVCGSMALGTVCAYPGVQVSIPASRARDANVTATGPTCDAEVLCGTPMANTPLGCSVRPRGEGTCHVVVSFSSGAAAVVRDVVFRRYGGCCSGLYPDDGNGSIFVAELPMADGGSDVPAADGDENDAE